MNIIKIYEKYHVMPILRTHMLKVAAVASFIVDHNSLLSVNKNEIVQACLLHDIGKLVEFRLGSIPGTIQENELGLWLKRQNEIKRKFGRFTDESTANIVKDIGVSLKVQQITNSIGFRFAKTNFENLNYSAMICCYADNRVSPYGIVSLKDRMEEGKIRYIANHGENDNSDFTLFSSYFYKIEELLFENCKISPSDIDDESVKEIVSDLSSYEFTV